jgi:hypothetical protein
VSIGKYSDALSKDRFIQGLDAVSKEDEPALLVFPDAVNLPENDLYEVQQAALQQAATLEDRFCILDVKFAGDITAHTTVINEFRSGIGIANLKYGAAYTPHLKYQTGGTEIILPPSGAVAGIYYQVDKSRGVWKAPANVSLTNVTGLAYSIDNNEQERLNIDTNEGKSINAIRYSCMGCPHFGGQR